MGFKAYGAVLLLALGHGCARVQLPEARITPGSAQEHLTWPRAVDLALSQHPDLRQRRSTLDAQRHNRNQALGAYLPTIAGSVARKRSRTTSSSTSDSLTFDVDVSQPIFEGFATTGAALQAWRQWEAAQWQYRETSAQVRLDLREAYVELLRLHKLLEVDQRIAARRQDNAELIRLRYEAGREHAGSWKRAQAIAEQAAFEVRQTRRRIDSQSLVLGRQLGGFFAQPMPVAGDLEQMVPDEPTPPADYVALAEATPPVQRLTRSAEALKVAILAEQSNLWPKVDGTFNYGYSGSKASKLKDDATAAVTVSVPLFAGGQHVQGVLEANATYRAAVEAARSQRDDRVATLSQRWAAFRDAWELVAVRRSFLEAARQRSEIVRAQYTTGLASFQDFDIAEQDLADSERAYVQSLADVQAQQAQWIQAQGGTLEEARNGT